MAESYALQTLRRERDRVLNERAAAYRKLEGTEYATEGYKNHFTHQAKTYTKQIEDLDRWIDHLANQVSEWGD